ncbi:hypothetical protein [Paraburkholderia gardini]|uniref:hypothetical protein n=1 Tax=Paraburkholderia gardini TaxID=2823469 RepID=UPI001DA1AA2D|nr:hypothetical protein [Paraburkholderia gardini]CAG4900295.1 hypothetical protein R69919_02728 [Paraburkholderia gardini]
MALYWQGKATPLTSVVAEVIQVTPMTSTGLAVDWLVNEQCDTLLIEGHVDLVAAAQAMHLEGGDAFPAPRHAWFRYMNAPEDEPVEPGHGWRGECTRGRLSRVASATAR